jgi:hypothetical protein
MAARFPHDIDSYIDGKGPLIEEIMAVGRRAATFEDFQPAETWSSRSAQHGNS